MIEIKTIEDLKRLYVESHEEEHPMFRNDVLLSLMLKILEPFYYNRYVIMERNIEGEITYQLFEIGNDYNITYIKGYENLKNFNDAKRIIDELEKNRISCALCIRVSICQVYINMLAAKNSVSSFNDKEALFSKFFNMAAVDCNGYME